MPEALPIAELHQGPILKEVLLPYDFAAMHR
jgi:hypothetical protein